MLDGVSSLKLLMESVDEEFELTVVGVVGGIGGLGVFQIDGMADLFDAGVGWV